ncbi:MAG: acetyl-CoA carboxylase biotin carboxyl carrier protein [Chitinophagaceae bacterium]|nr:acetyl-CoA carboxylase biotin carboxyl carrier protein [Chitinophagaceae bacterium]
MDFKQIQELIKIINKSNIGEISIVDKDFKIKIRQKEEHITQVVSSAPLREPTAVSAPAGGDTAQEKHKTGEQKPADHLITIKSPMIGTFYRRASPDKPILAEVGDDVTQGQVVCIIEAMKLFNEIESEVSGKIVKILAEDASPVEYDQPLFLVEPN